MKYSHRKTNVADLEAKSTVSLLLFYNPAENRTVLSRFFPGMFMVGLLQIELIGPSGGTYCCVPGWRHCARVAEGERRAGDGDWGGTEFWKPLLHISNYVETSLWSIK